MLYLKRRIAMPIKMPKGACLVWKPAKSKKTVFVEYSKGTKRRLSFPGRSDAAEHIYERIVLEDRIVPVYVYESDEEDGDGDMGYLKVTVTISTLGEVTVRITKP
jgi:hypothetical protein